MGTVDQSCARVVIVGAGMAGLSAARRLSTTGAHVTLIDAHNYTTFPPMFFYVATAFLAPEDVVTPTRALVPRGGAVQFQLGRVNAIDRAAQQVSLEDGRSIPFDYLVLAPGVVPSFGQVPGAARHAIPMKTPLDAARLRNNLLRCFEFAASHPQADAGMTSVAIIGGGPTGVEVAGYLADFLFRYSFPHDYPDLQPDRTRISLIESGDRLLPGFHPKLSRYALTRLVRRGVDVRLNTEVVAVEAAGITLADGDRVDASTVVWGGGVGVADWVSQLDLPMDAGRIVVEPDLRVLGCDDIFAIGDAAAVNAPGGRVYPQVAQVAIQGARHVARQIGHLVTGDTTEPFRYHDKGMMAMVARNAAVVQAGRIQITGRPAWIAWGLLHLAYLPGIVNRLSAGQKFLLWHFTHDTNVRILMEREREPDIAPQAATATNMSNDPARAVMSEPHSRRPLRAGAPVEAVASGSRGRR